MKRLWRYTWVSSLVLVPLSCFGVWFFTPDPPVIKIQNIQQEISRAKASRAPQFAPELLSEAEKRHERVMALWRQENSRWSFLRSYDEVIRTADDGIALARDSGLRSHAVQDSLYRLVLSNIMALNRKVQDIRFNPALIPGGASVLPLLVEAEIQIRESDHALKRQDFWVALEKIKTASDVLHTSQENLDAFVQDYLRQIPKWKQLASETIAWSRQNNAAAIIIDKMDRKCHVYISGRLSHSFPVELGPYWMGTKQRQGDRKTPEGRYHVIKKKANGKTKYYKALEINYPNAQDKEQFRLAKHSGKISSSSRIGGLIEIHGSGGRGNDWTEGCVALVNPQMDIVYNAASVGTPVTIIGAFEHPPEIATEPTSSKNGQKKTKRG
jgi:murein L,D-transpeptidase YafK